MNKTLYFVVAGIMAVLIIAIAAAAVFLLLTWPASPAAPAQPPAFTAPPPSPAAPTQPPAFTSIAGRFSVMSPGPFEEETQSLDIPPVGKIDLHSFTGQKGAVAYIVAYVDYPVEIVGQSDPEKLLDGGRDGMVGNVNGKLVSELKILLDNYPGREIVIDTLVGDGQEATIKARVYLVGNRLYQLMAIAPKGTGIGDIQPFLESFKLLPE